MTPKEKANELGNKFYQGSVFDYDNQGHLDEIVKAKERTKICIQEMLDFMTISLKWDDKTNGNIHFWQEVLDEVDGL
jgi:hypothetical protein